MTQFLLPAPGCTFIFCCPEPLTAGDGSSLGMHQKLLYPFLAFTYTSIEYEISGILSSVKPIPTDKSAIHRRSWKQVLQLSVPDPHDPASGQAFLPYFPPKKSSSKNNHYFFQ